MRSRKKDTQGSEITKGDHEPSLKGTFASVLLLGLFLVVSWVAIFILFLARQ
ncbi:hypothetical protein D3C71_2189450 [compost metagenome]